MQNDVPQKAAFIDRDGTLIEEVNFLSNVDDLRVFPFTYDAVKSLKDAGFLIIVVTNQSGIGRGVYGEAEMNQIHDEMQLQLDNMIDAFYFCPHLPEGGCYCRKPSLGMIEAAGRDLSIDMSRSWFVGDKDLDVEIGLNAGLRTVLVETGYGREHAKTLKRRPDRIAGNLLEAARYITKS